MSTFLCSDLRLFDKEIAKKMDLSVEDYNDFLISKFNEKVKSEDLTIFNGIISEGYIKETAALVKKMNGLKESCDKKHNLSERLPSVFWKKNFVRITNIQGYIITKDKKILILNDFELIKNLQRDDVLAAAIPGSQLKWKELYENRILNSSIENWNYAPIEIQDELPRIINSMSIFNAMENEEHTASWGESNG